MASRRLLVFLDVDGVLVPVKSSWQYVHEVLGTVEEAKLNYRLFIEGKIGYWEWMYLDTLAWVEAKPGITIWDLQRIFTNIPVTREARCAASVLREIGATIALVSGGVNVLVERVARILRADYWFSPKLAFDAKGRLVPGGDPVVEADRKDKIVAMLAQRLGVPVSRTVFIGDSVWDLKGMVAAGLAVAVNTSDERVLSVARIKAGDVCDAAKKLVDVFGS